MLRLKLIHASKRGQCWQQNWSIKSRHCFSFDIRVICTTGESSIDTTGPVEITIGSYISNSSNKHFNYVVSFFFNLVGIQTNVFFDLRLNKRLRKQSWGWWFEASSPPLWRNCNENTTIAQPCRTWCANTNFQSENIFLSIDHAVRSIAMKEICVIKLI